MTTPRRKPLPASMKLDRGTLRPSREKGVVEIATPLDPPMMPPWLTEDGKAAWLDNVGRVMQTGLAREIDSDLFATWCNLMGAMSRAWTSGDVPPAWAVGEARRLGELFGLAGVRSRIMRGGTDAGVNGPNPFGSNGRKPAGKLRPGHPAG